MKLLGGGVSGVEDFGQQFEQVDPNARIEMEDTSFNHGCCVGEAGSESADLTAHF